MHAPATTTFLVRDEDGGLHAMVVAGWGIEPEEAVAIAASGGQAWTGATRIMAGLATVSGTAGERAVPGVREGRGRIPSDWPAGRIAKASDELVDALPETATWKVTCPDGVRLFVAPVGFDDAAAASLLVAEIAGPFRLEALVGGVYAVPPDPVGSCADLVLADPSVLEAPAGPKGP